MLNIRELQELCHDKNIAITKHAKNRFMERSISIDDIKNAILKGEIIKQYEADKPFPSCLLLGLTLENKFIHVVVSTDCLYLYIITAYIPDENQWEIDFKTRKEC